MGKVRSKIRLFDLAKDLKIDTTRLIEEVRREGVDVSVPSNSISKDLAEKIRHRCCPSKDTSLKLVSLIYPLSVLADQNVNLSKRAKRKGEWKQLEEACRAGTVFRSRIVSRIKGGLNLKVLGFVAFLPREQLSEIKVRDFDRLKNKEIDVKITRLVLQGRRVFVSHDLVTDPRKLKPTLHLRTTPPESRLASNGHGSQHKTVRVRRPHPPPPRCKVRHCRSILCEADKKRCEGYCYSCYCERHPGARVRSMSQAGSPGLSKKFTVRIGKAKVTSNDATRWHKRRLVRLKGTKK